MALEPGSRLGPYEIVELRGKGGMGEVYLGRDTRLERDVAIKVLPEELGQDTLYRQRLEREAKSLSQLSHPHICTLHDIGSEDGVDFLVMEYLEGETLEGRLRRGALPLDEVAAIGSQIAEAIDAAHRHGVVHRDLKPGNVMLTRDGAKVLDFGLAKGVVHAGLAVGDTQTPTVTQPLTGEGSILGTLQYMAPEQLEGKEADERSDIWGLGAVLYEMVTGARPFAGESQVRLMAAIMTSEPEPLRERRPVAPDRLDWLVSRCLEKAPERRWHSAHDLALELEALTDRPETETAPAKRQVSAVLAGAFGLLALVVGLVLGFVLFRDGGDAASDAASDDTWTVTALDLEAAPDEPAVLSPDGRMVVFRRREGAETSLYRRSLGSLVVERISGSDGARSPIFSPDGKQLAFVDAGGSLKTLRVEGGGGASALVEGIRIRAAAVWGRDGFLYYTPEIGSATSRELWRIPAGGGVPEQVGRHGDGAALLPGERIALTQSRSERQDGFGRDVLAVDLETGKERVLLPGTQPRYLNPGVLVFYREGGLWAVPIDPETADLLGPARQVETGVAPSPGSVGAGGRFALADSGDLLYVLGSRNGDRLVWVSRDGLDIEEVAPERKPFSRPRHSLDWRRISVAARNARGNNEQWMLDLGTGSWTRPTQEGNRNTGAMWVPPDGREIVFASDRFEGRRQIYIQPADRRSSAERLVPSEHNQLPLDFSPDGRYLLYTGLLDVNGLWVFDRQSGESETLLEGKQVHAARFHPAGRWIAYSVRVEGQANVWIRPFPGPGEPRQLTFDGGEEASFSPEGREILYRSPTHMMTLPVEITGERLVTRRPEPLFVDEYLRVATRFQNYDIHPDGRFLMIQAAEDEEERRVFIQNWRAKVLEMFSDGGS